MLKLIFKYLRHILTSGHHSGRGIHSPYTFAFVNEAIFNSGRITAPSELDSARREIMRNTGHLEISDFGAGSRISGKPSRSVRSMARWSSVNKKSAKILYRISSWYKAETMIELGTGLGISTAWLARGNAGSKLLTVEGSAAKADFAEAFIASVGAGNVEIIRGRFDDHLPGLLKEMSGQEKLLVFIDGNHRYEPTLRYVDLILHGGTTDMMIVIDDIHWSPEMERAWKEIRMMEKVMVTLDLFFMGVVIVREGMKKEDYRLRL